MGGNPYTLGLGELERLLADDLPAGDATSHALGLAGRIGRIGFAARRPMVLCGSEEAVRLGRLHDLQPVGPWRGSGEALAAGETFLTLAGDAAALHAVWKTAQNLMEHLSGIASATAEIVAAARRGHPDCAVACTRKNFPGTKAASIKAILCGGASPHRLGLSETLLLFAEHRLFAADRTPAEVVGHLRRHWPERVVVVEVADEAEALCWATAGADILQLEKWPVDAVARFAQRHPGTRIAAAGGITAANAEAYAGAGSRILVTSAPYQAPPRDVAVTFAAL